MQPPKENKGSNENQDNRKEESPDAHTSKITPETGSQEKASPKQNINDASNKKEADNDLPKQGESVKEKKGKDGWDKALVIGTLVMALGTIVVIVISGKSLRSSNRAIIFADSSVKQAKRANDISEQSIAEVIRRNQISDSLKDITDKENRVKDSIFYTILQEGNERYKKESEINMSNTKESLEKQSEYLDQMKRQFEITNDPVLEIDNFSVSYEIGKPVIVKYNMRNLGRYRARIIGGSEFVASQFNIPNYKVLESNIDSNYGESGKYVVYESPKTFESRPGIMITKELFDALESGKIFIYFGCLIRYKNEENGEIKRFKGLYKLYNKGTDFSNIILKNIKE